MCKVPNEYKWYFHDCMYNAALLVCTGSMFQAFLLFRGIGERLVSVYATLVSVLQVLIMLSASAFLDRIRDLKRFYILTILLQAVISPAFLLFCGKTTLSPGWEFALVMLPVTLLSLLQGMRCVTAYKVPYHVIDMRSYARITLISCIVLYLFNVGFSAFASKLFGQHEFGMVQSLLYILQTAMFALCALSVKRMEFRPYGITENSKTDKTPLKQLFTEPRFYLLVPANVARGMASGILGLIVLFAARDLGANETFAARVVSVAQLASLASYIIYLALIKKASNRLLCLTGSVMFAFLPLAAFLKSEWLYLVIYAWVTIGVGFFSAAIPVILTECIPYEIMGGYTSWRMLLTTGGTALGSLLGGLLIGKVSTLILFAAAGALQLYCGGAYFKLSKQMISGR